VIGLCFRTTAGATHQGEFEGIPRTGRAVEVTGLVVYRVAEDKIAEPGLRSIVSD
jgi:predicted ester cyclase